MKSLLVYTLWSAIVLKTALMIADEPITMSTPEAQYLALAVVIVATVFLTIQLAPYFNSEVD